MTAMRTVDLARVLRSEASVEKTAKEYVVRLVVPGFAQDELEVEIADHLVTLRGDQVETGIDELPFRLHERFEERFQLPGDVDTESITASCTHGALELRVPRTNEQLEDTTQGAHRGPASRPCRPSSKEVVKDAT